MKAAVHGFAEARGPAMGLARALGVPHRDVAVHVFPDGESLVRVAEPGDTAILYRSLDHPNAKLVELLLAASALRDRGAGRVLLVAPYLAYMRQDRAFAAGEAVSQRVVGRLIADHFDALVTVEPHLHRTPSLGQVVPGRPAIALSAAPVLAEALRPLADGAVLVGPDSESRSWVEALAARLHRPSLIASKLRSGDRDVRVTLPGPVPVAQRAIIVDDMISTGATVRGCAAALRERGIADITVATVHCLAGDEALRALAAAGVTRIVATDGVAGAHASIALAGLLAGPVADLIAATP